MNHESSTISLTLLDVLSTSSEVQVISVGTGYTLIAEIRGFPVGGLPWADTKDIHCVYLLKRAVLAFNDEEVDDRS